MQVKDISIESIFESLSNKVQNISKATWTALVIVFGIAILNFGQIATQLTFNNDAIDRLQSGFYTFFYYIEIGRFTYPAVYHLFHFDTPVPFISVVVTSAMLTGIIYQLWILFSIKKLSTRIITGGMFLSFPLLIHYFFYIGDIEVYGFGMLLLTNTLLIFQKNKGKITTSGIVLNVIALGCYPALFSFINTGFLLVAIHQYQKSNNLKEALEWFLKGLLISAISLILYFIITKGLIYIFDLELTDYRGANETSITDLILEIPGKIPLVFHYFGLFLIQFKELFRAILMLLLALFIFYLIPTNKSIGLKIGFPILGFALSIVLIFSTYFITPESNLYIGFIYGILIFLVYAIQLVLQKSPSKLKMILFILFTIFIVDGIKNNNALTLTHQLNNNASLILANNILVEMQKQPEYHMKKTSVVFIGLLQNNPHVEFYSPELNISILNDMELPVGFALENRPYRIRNLIRTLNYDILFYHPEEDEYDLIYQKYENSPVYPESGSVFMEEGVLYVHLGK